MASRRLVRAGVVQSAPDFLNKEGSTEKALRFIAEAGRKGLDIVAFPEGFIPAHPLWYHFHPATSRVSLDLAARLFANAVTVPGPEIDALCAAAREHDVHVVIGVCEKLDDGSGRMYNTQVFIGRDGSLLGKHQKLTPTVGERLVHTGGFGDTLRVYSTDIGRIGGLICGENANHLAIAALNAQGIQIHVASWPSHFSMNEHRMCDAILFNTRSLAYKCGCFVLNACGTVSEEMKQILASTEEAAAFLSRVENIGGSTIIGANSEILAGPMSGDQEGILVAELDLEECVRAKLVHDYAGHYNRPDVLTLVLNRSVPKLFEERGAAPGAAAHRVSAAGQGRGSGFLYENGDGAAGGAVLHGTRATEAAAG